MNKKCFQKIQRTIEFIAVYASLDSPKYAPYFFQFAIDFLAFDINTHTYFQFIRTFRKKYESPNKLKI